MNPSGCNSGIVFGPGRLSKERDTVQTIPLGKCENCHTAQVSVFLKPPLPPSNLLSAKFCSKKVNIVITKMSFISKFNSLK